MQSFIGLETVKVTNTDSLPFLFPGQETVTWPRDELLSAKTQALKEYLIFPF